MPEKSKILAGVSLISAEILALELVLTRFFSISQGYHYAFLVVSIAFLGFGAGSLLLFIERLKNIRNREDFISRLAMLISLSILVSFFLVNRFLFNPVELLWNQNRICLMPVHFLILSLPFFLGGLVISSTLTFFPTIVHKIYFADLIGASLGIILSGLSFRLAGDRGAIGLLVLLAILSSWFFLEWKKANREYKVYQIGATLAILLIFMLFSHHFSFKISDYKPLSFYLKQKDAAIEKTLWDEKTRLDLFHSPAIRYAPGLSLKFSGIIPDQMGLSLDAEKISALIKTPDDLDRLTFLDYLPVSRAFKLAEAGRVLLIQPESDLELFLSLRNGASLVTVFEESSLIRQVHQNEISRLSKVMHKNCQIFLKTVEARAGLLQEKNEYDLIVFPFPDLPGSFSTGFYGPGEDYLLTREAAERMFNLLSQKGMITALFYYLPPSRQELRFMALWIETLEKLGLNPENHILILRSVETISFFIKKEPYSEEELQNWQDFAADHYFDLILPQPAVGQNRTSFIQSDLTFSEELLSGLFNREKRLEIYRRYIFEIKPPVDDRPFFRDFFKWSRWQDTLRFFNRKIYPLFLGKYLLVFLFAQSLLIGVIIIILPLLKATSTRLKNVPQKNLIFFYFASLGFGYMLVEITLFQKFILLLGHPTYSLSAVLFFLLSSSGAGSLSLPKLNHKIKESGLKFWPLVCMLAIFTEIIALNLARPLFLISSLPVRFGLSFLFIFPLGFCLGVPFPAGLKFFSSQSQLIIPLAFAANSFFGLLASVWGLLQAHACGYKSVLVLAALSYLLSFLFFYLAGHRDKPDIE